MNNHHPEFAFIGFTADCVVLLKHLLDAGCRFPPIFVDDATLVPKSHLSSINALSDWAELIALDSQTKILVGLPLELDSNQQIVRSLVSTGRTLIVVDPNADSLFAYELEMIRTESDAVLMPLCFTELDPPVEGSIYRHITIRENNSTRQLNPIITALTRDLIQLRPFVGTSKYLYAIAPGTTVPVSPATELDISVTLEMRNGTVIQWSNTGKTNLPTEYLFSNEELVKPERSFSNAPTPNQRLALFSTQHLNVSPSWLDYAKARETAEMIPLSLKKGRQIEVFDTHPTETDAFKGVMSGAGCFLLLFTLGVIGLFATFDAVTLSDMRDLHQTARSSPSAILPAPAPILVRLWPIYPFLAFLALQFFRGFIKKTRSPLNA
jgi:hypothetical protein